MNDVHILVVDDDPKVRALLRRCFEGEDFTVSEAKNGADLRAVLARERVTLTAGVPTIWMGVLQLLDANPGAHDLSSVRARFIGGAAVPQAGAGRR